LRSLLLDHHQQLLSNNNEIEHLQLVIAKLRRMIFGTKSERVEREIEQLELKLEEMETVRAERAVAQRTSLNSDAAKPSRRPLPEHLPREVHTHMPTAQACPECGGELRKFGEDISEMLEYVPSSFKVMRHVRPKLSCRGCAKVVQAEAPSRPIVRGIPGPGLLAHVLVAKYADHLPLYRQSEIYAAQTTAESAPPRSHRRTAALESGAHRFSRNYHPLLNKCPLKNKWTLNPPSNQLRDGQGVITGRLRCTDDLYDPAELAQGKQLS
jgi:transposase